MLERGELPWVHVDLKLAESRVYKSPSYRDHSLRRKANYLLKHEERRAYQKQYNVVGVTFIPVSRFAGKNFYSKFRRSDSTQGSCSLTKPHVIVYSRPGCHLCDDAKLAIETSGCSDRFTLQEVNIESDEELLRKYQYDIPIVLIDGVEVFRHRVDKDQFRGLVQVKFHG